MSKACQHGAFVVKTEVRTLKNRPDGPVVEYALDAEVACYDCGEVFIVPRGRIIPSGNYLLGHKTMKAENAN